MDDFETGETKVVLRAAWPERIQKAQWRFRQPGQSPQITYLRVNEEGRKELRLLAIDGSEDRQIPTGDLDLDQLKDRNISWDGSIMAAPIGTDGLVNEMVFLSLDGEWQRKIELNYYTTGYGQWFSDNRTFHLNMTTRPRLEIGIIENYLAASGRGQ